VRQTQTERKPRQKQPMQINAPLIKHALDDGLIVARPSGHRVFVMNASARFMWELLESGVDVAEIPARTAAHYGIDAGVAEADFRRTLAQWRRDGLAASANGLRHDYRLAGIAFSITCAEPAIETAIAPLFSHLEIFGVAVPDGRAKDFAVETEGCGLALLADGIELCRADTLDPILERLANDVVMHSYDNVDWLVSVHAAVLGNANSCVMLPGASGTGKSTLAACLLGRRKVRLLTDDIALLDRATLDVEPMPAPLVLKRGSWELVGGLPGLAAAPVRHRYGEEVRYIAPDRAQIAQGRMPVRAIVFPARSAAHPEAPRPLTQIEGLQRMLAAPATIRGPIAEETLVRLIRWSEAVAFYHLSYDRPEHAAAAVEALLAA
jgi:hypothetical protein